MNDSMNSKAREQEQQPARPKRTAEMIKPQNSLEEFLHTW